MVVLAYSLLFLVSIIISTITVHSPLIINTLAVFPYGSSLLLFNLLPSCWLLRKYTYVQIQPFSNSVHQGFTKNKRILLVVYHVIVAIVISYVFQSACQHCICGPLPKKPMLTAHRGCSMDAPENTLYSFK